ncbi:MAG TPA: 2-oxoglutarate ferredoxin oxidoreductase subunit alpha, partial [Phycisphaerae bacterium]|nr:2-oxoglutarate ferredoxin oxidoreductase subunit alpha [Phycisphaerae bacterium]
FRHLNPLPRNTGEVLAAFRRVLVCELNAGQFRRYLQSQFPIEAAGCVRVRGKPFTVADVRAAIERAWTGKK